MFLFANNQKIEKEKKRITCFIILLFTAHTLELGRLYQNTKRNNDKGIKTVIYK